MVESSLLRMRKPCFFVSSSKGGSVFSSSSFSSSSVSFSPSSPSSPVSVSVPSSEPLLFTAWERSDKRLTVNKRLCHKKKNTRWTFKFWCVHSTFLSSLTSLEMTVHMSWQPGNSNVVTTWGRMLLWEQNGNKAKCISRLFGVLFKPHNMMLLQTTKVW